MQAFRHTWVLVALSIAGSAVAQTTNSIPFSDSFEIYASDTVLNGTNGWTGSAAVTNLSYAYEAASNGYPVAGSHTNVLDVSGGAANQIDGASSSVVWVDSILSAESFWTGPGHPAVDTNANACIYVDADGHLVAGHTQYGSSNLVWSVFNDVLISSNDWNRVVLQLDYLTHYYSIMLNGVLLDHSNGRTASDGSGAGGAWFPMIGNFPFSGIALEGDAFVDDLVVSEEAPYPFISVADAGSVSEGDSGTTAADFTISLSAGSTIPVTIDYATADGTASAGVDYIAKAGTLTIPAGSLQAVVGVQIIGDTNVESDVSFTLNISDPVNALVGDASGSATIDDDDIVVISGLEVSGTTMKIIDGAPGNPSGGVTNHFLASETLDWVVWDSAAVTPSERKSGGTAFSGFTSSQTWSSGSGNRLFIAWTDGDPTPSAINFNALAMASVGEGVPYVAMDFSLGLNAVTVDSFYRLTLYMTDKRNNSSVNYWDAGAGDYVAVTSDTDNDAADLRIHEIIISNVTANTAVPFRITGEQWGSGYPVALGGMEMELVGSIVTPPELSPFEDWTGRFGLSGSNALMTADADGSGFNNLYEYVFDGDPTNAVDNGIDPLHALSGDDIEYVYLRRTDTNLLYTVLVSTNLVEGSWGTNGVVETGTDSLGEDFDEVTNAVSTIGEDQGYIRLKVDALP